MATRGYGVAGALDHSIVATVASAVEKAGWGEFWANDTPGGDGLAALAAALPVTRHIHLGVGVIPVDRLPPRAIAQRIRELELPEDRLILGIGSGGTHKGALAMMRSAVAELRDLTSARVFLGALGPAMCALSGEVADGVLLNWLTPTHGAESRQRIRAAAESAGRPTPTIAAYVRGALPAGETRLQTEADRYASYPAYAAHFERMGVQAIETAVHGSAGAIAGGLAAYDGSVDAVILRAIVGEETAEAYLALLTAASVRL